MPDLVVSRGRHFFALPSTTLGRASAGLFLVALLFWFVGLFVQNWELYIGSVNLVALVLIVGFFGAFFTGAVALIGYRERSWAVWVATLLPALVIGADVVLGLLQGGG
jgi:hypothetical protein